MPVTGARRQYYASSFPVCHRQLTQAADVVVVANDLIKIDCIIPTSLRIFIYA